MRFVKQLQTAPFLCHLGLMLSAADPSKGAAMRRDENIIEPMVNYVDLLQSG